MLISWLKQGRVRPSCSRIKTHGFSSLAFPEPTRVLVLSGLFPEPNASAAGVRTKALLTLLSQTGGVQGIHYGTGAKSNHHHSEIMTTTPDTCSSTVQFHHVPPNDSEAMKQFLRNSVGKTTEQHEKVLVIMDRFYAEEAYSFHIHQQLPEAAIVLDMQDVHSLRRHRQSIIYTRSVKSQDEQEDPLQYLPIDDIPSAQDSNLQRELASIHRSDLTLVCSPVELRMLRDIYHVPEEKLCLASFFVDQQPNNGGSSSSIDSSNHKTSPQQPSYCSRQDFVFIGGFKHEPNCDAVRQMHNKLWPRIRDDIQAKTGEETNFHVYGPFCPRSLREECHDPTNGFFVHGFADEPAIRVLSRHRILLSPLRFGAGIKGKIVDSWAAGTPVVTTTIGSEGMEDKARSSKGDGDFGGVVAHTSEEFVQAAVRLYTDQVLWSQKQELGSALLEQNYGMHNWERVASKLIHTVKTLEERRQSDHLRGVLWQQTLRSTEYFSRWIESKDHKH